MATAQQTTTGTTITGIDLACYFVSDPARAIAFYRDKLGVQPTEIDEEGRGAEFTLPDGSTFGVWHDGDSPTTGGAMMFAVGDAHATVALLRSRGVEISEPMETPVCFMAFGQDPDNNPFIVHQRKPGHA
jgi:predicted enzyme related to lactoylglutathione lyase